VGIQSCDPTVFSPKGARGYSWYDSFPTNWDGGLVPIPFNWGNPCLGRVGGGETMRNWKVANREISEKDWLNQP